MRRRVLAATVVVAALAAPASARADARELAARVVTEWREAGAEATLLPTRFVFDEESSLVTLPMVPETACTAVAIIGARGLSFRARLSDVPMDPLVPPEPAARGQSTGGVLELRRCEPGRPRVRHVVVTAEAGRGAVEFVVARSDKALPALSALLPERTGGVLPPPAEAGALPALAAQDQRAGAAEARARREGATLRARTKLRAGDEGSGEAELELDEGCHRIEVFGREALRERPGRRFRLDLDAELKDGEGHLLARDRTEAPDARLETCLGAPDALRLAFAGAPASSEVLVTRGTWPLPAKLPELWGPVPRSKMARAMFLRHIAVPSDDAVFLAQGSSGTTPLPLSVEAGACYVAVAGVARGRVRQLQLRAFIGARESTDERGAAEEAALVAFCVNAGEPARLEVLARGTSLAWGLALFRVKSGMWEAGR